MRRKAQVDGWLQSIKKENPKPYLALPERTGADDIPVLRKLESTETYATLQEAQTPAVLNAGVAMAARVAMMVNFRLGGTDPAAAPPASAVPSLVTAIPTPATGMAALPVAGAAVSTAMPGGMMQQNGIPTATGVPTDATHPYAAMQYTADGQMLTAQQQHVVVAQAQEQAGYYNVPQQMMMTGADGMPIMAGGRPASTKHCIHPGCTKGAIGKLRLCIAHGGGKRCSVDGCQKAAQGQKPLCKAHGGGRRCKHPGCPRSARDRTDLCIGHGGGKRCIYNGCQTSARSGTVYFSLHDGVIKKHTGVTYTVPGMMPAGMMPANGMYPGM